MRKSVVLRLEMMGVLEWTGGEMPEELVTEPTVDSERLKTDSTTSGQYGFAGKTRHYGWARSIEFGKKGAFGKNNKSALLLQCKMA